MKQICCLNQRKCLCVFRAAYHLGETFWRQTELWEACLGTPLKTLSEA